MGPTKLWPALVVVCSAWVACATPPPLPLPTPEETPTPSVQETWVRDFPPDLSKVRLHAYPDCLFITANKTAATDPPRVQLCVDPNTGEVRWAHTVEVKGSRHLTDEYFITSQHLLYSNRQDIIALSRSSGEVSWKFTGTESQPLYSTFVHKDTVVVSVGNQELWLLDANTGKPTGAFALRDDAIKGVVALPQGLIAAIVRVDPKTPEAPRLVGAPLQDPGSVEKPKELTEAWSIPITTWSYDLHVVDDVLVGSFQEGEMWAVDAHTGKQIWKLPEDSVSGSMLFATKNMLLSKTGTQPTTTGPDKTVVRIVSVPPRNLPEVSSSWTLDLPSKQRLLGIEELEGDPRTLGATEDLLFQFDVEQGKLLWAYSFNPDNEPGYWTNASSNGDAAYLYFEQAGRPGKLKRIPVLRE